MKLRVEPGQLCLPYPLLLASTAQGSASGIPCNPCASLAGETREFTFYCIIRAMGVALVEYSSGVHAALNTAPKKKKGMEGRRQKKRKGREGIRRLRESQQEQMYPGLKQS